MLLQYSEKTVHRGTGRRDNYRDRGGGRVCVCVCECEGQVEPYGLRCACFFWRRLDVKQSIVLLMSRCYSIAENEYCQRRGREGCKDREKNCPHAYEMWVDWLDWVESQSRL